MSVDIVEKQQSAKSHENGASVFSKCCTHLAFFAKQTKWNFVCWLYLYYYSFGLFIYFIFPFKD